VCVCVCVFIFDASIYVFAILLFVFCDRASEIGKIVFRKTMIDLKSCDIVNSLLKSTLTYEHKKR
jgi:hypothetical protein